MKALKRKNVKRTLACVLGVSLLLTAMAVPALAEEQNTVPQIQSSDVTAKGGRPGNGRMQNGPQGQMPGNGNQNGPQGQMPGNGNQNQSGPRGQMPGNGSQNQNGPQGQMPGNGSQNQNGQQGQTPDANSQATPVNPAPGTENQNAENGQNTNGQNAENSQNAENGQNGTNGNNTGKQNRGKGGRPGRNGGKQAAGQQAPAAPFDLKVLVEKGIIDQETADKIEEYLQNNAPAQPAEGQAPADGTAPAQPEENQAAAEGTTPPEAPVNGQMPPEMPAGTAQGLPAELTAKLVEEGLLTQEQADAISALNAAGGTEAAASEAAAASAETAVDG